MTFSESLAKDELPNQDRHFFGRRQSRPLSPARKAAVDALLPTLSVPESDLKKDGALEPASLFKEAYSEHWLEVGFGSGEHVIGLMEQHPDRGFLAAEPYINGMSAFLKDIEDIPHDNVRVHMDDALSLVKSIKSASIDGLYILNPDPWHKARHHKRRIVRPETLDEYARVLKPGGALIMSTDVHDLANWMFTHTFNHPAFEWSAQSADDWRTPPENWITTKYQQKGAKNSASMSYLIFEKRN